MHVCVCVSLYLVLLPGLWYPFDPDPAGGTMAGVYGANFLWAALNIRSVARLPILTCPSS